MVVTLTVASAAFTFTLAMIMTAQVIMRYLLNLPFLGIEEISILFAQWTYFTAAALASARQDHIVGGFLALLDAESWWHRPARALSISVSLAVLLVSLFYAVEYLSFTFSTDRRSPYLGLPSTLWVAAPAFGLAAMCAYELRTVWRGRQSK